MIDLKTLENMKELMMGKTVLNDLIDVLREKDEAFELAEERYQKATQVLRQMLSPESSPSLEEYLTACESDVIAGVVYAGYLGFRVNLENFHHPIGINFVHLDTIDYLKGHLFGHYPQSQSCAQIREAFREELPEDLRQLYEDIRDYFTHLECAGPKLAHYAGYVIGNQLLPWVEPGYRADEVQTRAFALETERYMGFLPL